jgi:hypothetical protein
MSTPTERTLEAKLAAITDHFALGRVQTFERTSGTNQNYLVTTSVGDYLFKLLVSTTLESVLISLPFLHRLAREAALARSAVSSQRTSGGY